MVVKHGGGREEILFSRKNCPGGIVQFATLFLSNPIYSVENIYGKL